MPPALIACAICLCIASCLVAACGPGETRPTRFLALGDSYTIGESVAENERWPVQLVARLRDEGLAVDEPQIIARTGWTTDELLAAIERQAPQGPYDLVTLLIGVNNQYQGRELDNYRQEFQTLLERAIDLSGGEPSRVVVVSIPDWGVMPFAEGRNRAQIGREIDAFNAVNREETSKAGARYVDITPLSRQAASNGDLVATDGLHVSGVMYTAWVDQMLPQVLAVVGQGE